MWKVLDPDSFGFGSQNLYNLSYLYLSRWLEKTYDVRASPFTSTASIIQDSMTYIRSHSLRLYINIE